jgi:hypothetical protein
MCKIIILTLVLYGWETRFLALREEHRLRLYENRVLRRIFGPKREEVAGGWRRLRIDISYVVFFTKCYLRLSYQGG